MESPNLLTGIGAAGGMLVGHIDFEDVSVGLTGTAIICKRKLRVTETVILRRIRPGLQHLRIQVDRK